MPHALFYLMSSVQCWVSNNKIKEIKSQITSSIFCWPLEANNKSQIFKNENVIAPTLPVTNMPLFQHVRWVFRQRIIDTIICLICECQAGLFHMHSVKHSLKKKRKKLCLVFFILCIYSKKKVWWVKFTMSKQKTGSLSKYMNRGKGDLFPEFQQMSYLIGCEINQSYSRPVSLVSAVKTLSNMCISLLLVIMRVWGENQTSKRSKAARMLYTGLQID